MHVNAYDVQVAKQVALLTKFNLKVRISMKGQVSFEPVAPWYLRPTSHERTEE